MVDLIVIDDGTGIDQDERWMISTILGRWVDNKRRRITVELPWVVDVMSKIAEMQFTHASLGVLNEMDIVRVLPSNTEQLKCHFF